MNLVKAAHLFVSQAVWNVTGLNAAGRTLVRALDSDDENLRTIAGMFLVQAGQRAEPLLEEALHKGQSLPMVIDVLGSIGAPKVVAALRPFLDNPNSEIAQAARDAIRVIDASCQSNFSERSHNP